MDDFIAVSFKLPVGGMVMAVHDASTGKVFSAIVTKPEYEAICAAPAVLRNMLALLQDAVTDG